jgi:DUF4097 and DUF4098 domain-containing protein YvlB
MIRASVALLLVALAARADAAPLARVEVRGGSGRVTVTGSPAAKGVSGDGKIAVLGSTATVRGEHPHDEIKIAVPAGVDLGVTTWSGDIAVVGVGGAISLRTVSGRLEVRGRVKRLAARSVSGALAVEELAGPAEVKTVNGAIRIKGKLDGISAASVSGAVSLEGLSDGRVSTTSGPITVQGAIGKGKRGQVRTHSGRIELRLRAPAGLRYTLRSAMGRVELAGARASAGGGDGRTTQGTLGAGGGALEASSFSGDIRLELKP